MRLIDADALKERFREEIDANFSDDYGNGFQAGILTVDSAPTVDAKPVTHAHWDKSYCIGENNTKLQDGYKCSHCGHYVPDTSVGFYYCDNCGAKMGGDTHD